MKLLLTFLICLTFATGGYSQGKPMQARDKGKAFTREQIMSQKVAYFTEKMELTPEEAQVFWPVYNSGWKALHEARRNTNIALGKMHEAIHGENRKTSEEIKELTEAYFQACKNEIQVQQDNLDRLYKVLSAEKAAMTIILEENFRIMLIRQLRSMEKD